jgi:hypothetical protein
MVPVRSHTQFNSFIDASHCDNARNEQNTLRQRASEREREENCLRVENSLAHYCVNKKYLYIQEKSLHYNITQPLEGEMCERAATREKEREKRASAIGKLVQLEGHTINS